MKPLDLSNQKFGKLTAIKRVESPDRYTRWLCKCECGKEVSVRTDYLRNGHTTSCGCACGRTDITGQTFGYLTALKQIPGGKWKCQCKCGNIVEVYTYNLKNGNTKSCGCYQKERASEANFISLVGQKFGRLLVEERGPNDSCNQVAYYCKCDCGNRVLVNANNLRRGTTQSCGCLKSELTVKRNTIDLKDMVFGKLTVLEKTEKRSQGSVIWKCRCECGNIKEVNGSNLRQGYTRSCGCSTISHGEEEIMKILDNNKIPYLYDLSYFNNLDVGRGWNGRFDFILYPDSKQIRLVEFDGEQHFKEWRLSDEPLSERKKRDEIKNNFAKENNIPLVRIPYTELNNITLDMILGDQYLINKEEV